MIRNRRKYSRTSPNDPYCVFALGQGFTDAKVINKSPEGIRVGDLDLMILFVDQQVIVECEGEAFYGRCRTVSRDSNGAFEVGILREPEGFVGNSESILINSYVQLGDQQVVCIPTQMEEQTIQITLLNNEQLSVHVNQVTQMTRQERLEELCDSGCLDKVMAVYGMACSGNDFTDQPLLLNHEFGPTVQPYESTPVAHGSRDSLRG